MQLSELIEKAQEVMDSVGDVEVRIAEQPSWPFENRVADAQLIEDEDETNENEPVFYLEDGGQIGYLPGYVSEALGWSGE